MRSEADTSLDWMQQILKTNGKIEMQSRRLLDRRAYILDFVCVLKETRIMLSEEFLSDLPAKRDHQFSVELYLRSLEKRMENASPSDFFCASGIPLSIKIDWPIERAQRRDATYVHAAACDLRNQQSTAKCSIIIAGQQECFDLKRDAFRREMAIINTMRAAADRKQLKFSSRGAPETPFVEIDLEVRPRSDRSLPTAKEFLAGKVYWLAFKRGDRRTKVWIADPWDLEYLGLQQKDFIQDAQGLEVEKMITLDSSQEFAVAGDELIRRGPGIGLESAGQASAPPSAGKSEESQVEWDVFICHASENKEDFVRPLAEALRERGLKAWYDEFTLKVGDSLRRSIDRGLKCSRFGVVVLSREFFAKDWPRRELDGLVAKETGAKNLILPVWHQVTFADVRNYSPTLADRFAVSSAEGVNLVVDKLLEAIGKSKSG